VRSNPIALKDILEEDYLSNLALKIADAVRRLPASWAKLLGTKGKLEFLVDLDVEISANRIRLGRVIPSGGIFKGRPNIADILDSEG
jgi:hypothetical protein